MGAGVGFGGGVAMRSTGSVGFGEVVPRSSVARCFLAAAEEGCSFGSCSSSVSVGGIVLLRVVGSRLDFAGSLSPDGFAALAWSTFEPVVSMSAAFLFVIDPDGFAAIASSLFELAVPMTAAFFFVFDFLRRLFFLGFVLAPGFVPAGGDIVRAKNQTSTERNNGKTREERRREVRGAGKMGVAIDKELEKRVWQQQDGYRTDRLRNHQHTFC